MLAGNITLSQNKVKNFTEYIDDYDNGGQFINKLDQLILPFHQLTSSAVIKIFPVKNLRLIW